MKSFCAIYKEKDKVFISFASMRKGQLNFLREIEIEIPAHYENIMEFFKEHMEFINSKIREQAEKESLRINRIFVNLPKDSEQHSVVEDIVPLFKQKKLSTSDIAYAKRHIENVFLNEDDFCFHHYILSCEVNGKLYNNIPLGVRTNKIKIKSCLFWIKDSVRKGIEHVFDNVEQTLGGFVSSDMSAVSMLLPVPATQTKMAILKVGYTQSLLVLGQDKMIDISKEYDFSLKRIKEELKRNFSISIFLADEIFTRHVSFQEVSSAKVLSVKKGETYLKLSLHEINSFIKEYIKREINFIAQDIYDRYGETFVIGFVGCLNQKEGFLSYLKELFPLSVQIHLIDDGMSFSYGCLKYGVYSFWEKGFLPKEPFLKKIVQTATDYF